MTTICKGQNLRLFVWSKIGSEAGELPVGFATNCTLHVAANLEDSSTKDSTGDWQEQEITDRSWDMSVDALVPTDAKVDDGSWTIHDFYDAFLAGETIGVFLYQTDGEENRTFVQETICYFGHCYVSDISVQAQNRQNTTYAIQLTGTGELHKSTA